jgi:hypothetical protein
MTTPHPNYQTIRLAKGHHLPGDNEGCLVEVAGLLHKREWTGDGPKCFCPVLMNVGRIVNDSLRDDERHVLMPYTLRFGGTNDGTSRQRTVRIIDWYARTLIPWRLDWRATHKLGRRIMVRREFRRRARTLRSLPAFDGQDRAWLSTVSKFISGRDCPAWLELRRSAQRVIGSPSWDGSDTSWDTEWTPGWGLSYEAPAVLVGAAWAEMLRNSSSSADRDDRIALMLGLFDDIFPAAPAADDIAQLGWDALEPLTTPSVATGDLESVPVP